MWFTQVSLRNPVFATMVMLAFVVLGVFGYQRLQVDQFPNVDFPVVVVNTAYPGASPEIVEVEVSRKIEEALNTISGINALTSRSYQGASVVIAAFDLDVDSRKAADDVREKVAAVKASLRKEVEEPRIQRFDPASRPIFSIAVTLDNAQAGALSASQVSSWADQVLRKRIENVRGVGAVSLIGNTERAIQIELKPQAMRALGVTAEQVAAALRSENQEAPVGTVASDSREFVVQVQARMQRPSDFGNLIVARKGGASIRLDQVAVVRDADKEIENLALYNGQRTVLLEIQKAQDENTVQITDRLQAELDEIKKNLPPGISLTAIGDSARPIRVSVANVKQTLIEGAFLTVAIVFLFLNSWRSTVITGLTLPIAIIGTFLFMDLLGFTINMVTLMAMSLCVGLLIDDAIVVRENIVRHVQMGKTPYNAAMDGTQEIGLAVLATTLSIVAVFAPIGFMGGIIGKFFHQFGLTIVAAVLISMFVSFTLDPMLSSIWHDPAIDNHGKPFKPDTFYNKTIGRVTHAFDVWQDKLADSYQQTLAWSLRHKLATLSVAVGTFVASIAMMPLLGSEFVPKADFSETRLSFYTPVGSSLAVTEQKTKQVESILREFPEVSYTLSTINTGSARGKIYVNVYVRLVDRDSRTLGVDEMSARLRERLRTVSGVTVTHVGMNPTRTGIFKMLEAMGADLTYANEREVGGEPVADITARHSALRGIEVPPEVAPSMIDEFPVFFVAACMAQGQTITSGLDELRVKESDRLALMATGLKAIGAQVEEREDGLVIQGSGGEPLEGGATINSALDHRIAMSFAVAGQHCYHPVTVDDVSPIATSFPTFEAMMHNLQVAQ